MSYEVDKDQRKRRATAYLNTAVNTDAELLRKYKNMRFLHVEKHVPDGKPELWVFLSHSFKDFTSVRLLRNVLEEQGYFPLMFFLKCIDDDHELESLIKREIECRTNFILCDSANARQSKWVQREVSFIQALNRNYEVVDISGNLGEVKDKIFQLTRRLTIFLSFDQDHEGIAYAMYLRLSKYDFNIILRPLGEFKGKDYYECTSDDFSHLMDNGIVVVIAGEWASDQINQFRKEWLLAIENNKSHEPSYLFTFVFEQGLSKKLDGVECVKLENVDVYDRVDAAVNRVLSRMLTPSSMIVYVETFRTTGDIVEAGHLYKLIRQGADQNNAGDMAALGKCFENGWGGDKDLWDALHCYTRAEELVGFPVYEEEMSNIEEKIKASKPQKKPGFWKKLWLFLKLLFWPFD